MREHAATTADTSIVEEKMDLVGALMLGDLVAKSLDCAASDTSARCVVTRSPCGSPAVSQSCRVSAIPSSETSHIATLQASAASWRTSSRPMPEPPPVTTAIFPAKSFIY